MAEKEISDLISRLNLHSTERRYTYTVASDENKTDNSKSHKRRFRHRPKSQKSDNHKDLPQQNHVPTQKNDQSSRGTKKAERPEKPPLIKADSSSQLNRRDQQISKEEFVGNDSSLLITPPYHAYVVQIMHPSEVIESVCSSLVDANNRALKYLEIQHGIKANEISDKRGLFGQAVSTAKATKRTWNPTGTLEILTRGGSPWIKVLEKPLYSDQAKAGAKLVYLSIDRCDGIFVIGAYKSQKEAWQNCKKYWSDLAVCSSMSDLKDWHDEGFHHAQVRIASKWHKWSLKEYRMM
ncbi:hypothetical protein BGW36DRAFT_406730 [Talaromyces proteolyticus]|uniref:Uncharacterized protein n=1 Tax=Talaromyces proteolyticus TaxID=1131652 RepID=A0AAD4Q1S0_9EURO|nr:uncharacterized protein BGW36DRAFT_406730 [Talaromyces proteolyticus]KAH8698848.1 hypothetical protein BGW36DRAFT_406730 [Talaromyces proteolyticus]